MSRAFTGASDAGYVIKMRQLNFDCDPSGNERFTYIALNIEGYSNEFAGQGRFWIDNF
jgi:hypothetical protein